MRTPVGNVVRLNLIIDLLASVIGALTPTLKYGVVLLSWSGVKIWIQESWILSGPSLPSPNIGSEGVMFIV